MGAGREDGAGLVGEREEGREMEEERCKKDRKECSEEKDKKMEGEEERKRKRKIRGEDNISQ